MAAFLENVFWVPAQVTCLLLSQLLWPGGWTKLTVLAYVVPSTHALSPAPTQTENHCLGTVGSLMEVRFVEPTSILIGSIAVFHWSQLPALALTVSNAERKQPSQSTGSSSSGVFCHPNLRPSPTGLLHFYLRAKIAPLAGAQNK